MSSLAIKRKVKSSSFSSDIGDALQMALLGHSDNHLSDYLYSTPKNDNDPVRGAEFYENMIETCGDYYLYRAEIDLIKSSALNISNIIGSNFVVVENGPGPQNAVMKKTIPLLSALNNPKSYIAVDICSEYANAAASVVAQKFPTISTDVNVADMFSSNDNIMLDEKSVMVFFGALIMNLDVKDSESFINILPDYFKTVRSRFKKTGYVLFAQDTNQDELSLKRAYLNSTNETFNRSILYRIARDSCPIGWDPDLWEYRVIWCPKKYKLDIGFVCKAAHSIKLNLNVFNIKKGQFIHVISSYKLPESVFLDAARKGGFMPVQTFRQPGNPVVLHLLRVAA